MLQKTLLRLLAVLIICSLFSSCDEDDDYYYGPPVPPDDFEYLDAWALMAPPMCPELIYPDYPEDAGWFNDYDNQVIVLNSVRDVDYFFTRDQLYMYPDLTTVDFRYYSVIIYTAYLPYMVSTYDYSWSFNYSVPGGEYWLRLGLDTMGPSPYRGSLSLFQAAVQVDKVIANSNIYATYEYNN